ncbi:MFS transporter [Corynebacterium sp.]|uniref:MFS transporter n=1 Tax=Corynebacterium sp. TaxID=1720 RepID=UPI0026DAE2AD|nr:MFS transporter [Corynebacterium sp.]MDO5076984.1 MFS transporter [Corynebacterium sp.]
MNSQTPPRTHRSGFQTFLLIWAAQFIARTGNGLTAFGLGVYVYHLTGLTTPVAMIAMASFLPSVLLAPFGGVIADRFDRRIVMILGDASSASGLFLLLIALHQQASVAVLCACVALSSVCQSVMEPAYRATVSDLLTPEEYARAGGMVQLASASQYLIAPALGGMLLARFNITLLITIDICTMCTTILAMVFVWRTIASATPTQEENFWKQFRDGVAFFAHERGVLTMLYLITLVTFCIGFVQTLFTPLVLDLADERTLGLLTSTAACGMLVSSGIIGAKGTGNNHLRYLSLGLLAAGITVAGIGARPNVIVIAVFAFAFFMTLPVLNTSLEVLVRAAIPNETQGRIWGLVSLISQLGYLIAYAFAGPLADHVFNPLLQPDGALAPTVGQLIGVGGERGIGLMLLLVGALLAAIAATLQRSRSARKLQTHFLNTLEATRNEPNGRDGQS